jgi:polyhydroxyalkanoate synthesis regulator phasin|tara:strand:- start:540 stop:875 length:336 start_codon:yes stop_codon:yes gene_type:complete
MQITKEQLKQIIKEELTQVLNEGDTQQVLIDVIEELTDEMLNDGDINMDDYDQMKEFIQYENDDFVSDFVEEVSPDGSNVREIAMNFVRRITNPDDDLESFNQRDKLGRDF